MDKTRVLISINGHEPISNNEFFDVSIYSAIDFSLPEITFKVRDEHGHHLSTFDIFPGARVDVIIEDYNNPEDNIQFTNFSITEIYDGQEFKNAHLGGYIQVWAKQSWEFYGDWTSHAYPPMKLSELIKKVCAGANKLAGIKVSDENFKESSDAGNMPRYKENMSEIDFIEQRCLPYLNVSDSCGFFYVDFYGQAHVSSFSEMYSQNEKILVRQTATQANNDEEFNDLLHEKNFDKQYVYQSMKIKIGNRDLASSVGKLKMLCFFENDATGKFASGTSLPKIKIKDSAKNTIKDRVPVNSARLASIDELQTSSFIWHNLNDGLAMANNAELGLSDFLKVTLTFENFPKDIKIGDTIYLFVPKYESAENAKNNVHWVLGKWLVSSMNIGVQFEQGSQRVSTEIDVISPTINIDVTNTTIKNPKEFYKVV